MRIDPDAVYLELEASTLVGNVRTGDTRYVPAVWLHWKTGGRWQRRMFVANENNGDTLGAILERLGGWIDQHGLQGALDQAMGPAVGGPPTTKETR